MIHWRQPKCVKPICDLNEGEKGRIVQIRGKIVEHRYLSLLGIAVGRSIIIDKVVTTPRERIITLAVGDIKFTLDKIMSQNIQVEVPLTAGEREVQFLRKVYAKAV
jgi:Fe2+ transport system protein FeoA